MDVKKLFEECRECALSKDAHMQKEEMLLRIKGRRENIGLDISQVSKDIECEELFLTRANKRQDEAMALLSNLSGLEYDVLYYYYVDGIKTWDKVADYLSWCIRSVHNARRSAFKKLQSIYEEEKRK